MSSLAHVTRTYSLKVRSLLLTVSVTAWVIIITVALWMPALPQI